MERSCGRFRHPQSTRKQEDGDEERSEATAILKGEAYRLFYVHKNKFNIIRFIIITSWRKAKHKVYLS